MIKCAAAIHREPEVVARSAPSSRARYGGGDGHVTPEQAAKRVALQFVVAQTSPPGTTASWPAG